jgi:RHS repeat-associated protein
MGVNWEGIVNAYQMPRSVQLNEYARNPGLVADSYYQPVTQPQPQVSTLFEEYPLLDPSYVQQPDRITFQTSFGEYGFSKIQPSMSFTSRDGTLLVAYSVFHVTTTLPAPILYRDYAINMTSLSNTHIDYSVSLTNRNQSAGVLSVSVNFDRVQKPKIAVQLQPSQALASAGFNIVWVVRGINTFVRLERLHQDLDFGNVTSLGSYRLNETAIDMGPVGSSPDAWRAWAQVDWRDAAAGSYLDFGTLPALSFIGGSAAVVSFPANQSNVDPTIVGQSTSGSGTALSTQRRVFFDGSNYQYSSDGLTWNSGAKVLWSYQSAAVWYASGSVYALAGSTGSGGTSVTVYLYFVKGTISGTTISWGSTVTVDSYTYSDSTASAVQASYSGVNLAVGSDGLITVAYARIAFSTYTDCEKTCVYYYASSRYLQVRKSSDVNGASWGAATQLLSEVRPGDIEAYNRTYVSILSPLSSGVMLGIYDDNGAIKYSTSSSWGSVTNVDNTTATSSQFGSAVSDSGYNVRFVYVGSDGSIKYRYYGVGAWSTAQSIAGATGSAPQISLGAGGDLHALYFSSNVLYYVHYSAVSGWGVASTPFGYTSFNNPAYLTATADASNGYLLAEWTEGTASPYSIKLGSLPILSSWSPYSIPSDPWDEEGIIPDGQYYQNYQEYVSPFTGLLTVLQPDFTLPGRGFGDAGTLAFTRVFTTPYSFQGSTPFNYEAYPYANLGYGWSLNWPWLGPNYLHLWNGQGYRIVWMGGVFENHKGVDFKLTQNTNGTYTLYDKSGTIYEFDSSKRLSYIQDRTGNNKATFTYDSSGRISVITDTMGRTINFAYSGNYLSTVTAAGRKWTYGINAGQLASVTDPQGRVTSYKYNPNNSNPPNNYLIGQITYPNGAYTAYTYGTSTNTYRISSMKTVLSDGTVQRQVSFSYTVGYPGSTDYVTSATLTVSNATTTQGYYQYAFQPTTMTLTTENGQAQPMSKTTDTFDSLGHVSQETVYPGGGSTSYTNYFNYDNWGNTVYRRLAITATTYRETFYSYANTNTTNTYVDYNGHAVSGFTNSFYSNTVSASIHNLPVGQAEYQNGAGSNRVESYYQYDSQGDLTQEKDLLGSSQWVTTSYTYDSYGNALTRTDANGHQTTYTYNSTYQYAYRTRASNIVGGVTLTSQYGYNRTTGDLTQVISPSGNLTNYAYDQIDRITSIKYPAIAGVQAQRRAVYDDVNHIVTLYDENNNYTKYYYDALSRLTKVETYSGGSVYSTQTYSYYWNDKVQTVTDPTGNKTTYTYDFLGRTLKLIHPDNTYKQWSYNDVNSQVTAYDEKAHPTDYFYDWQGRLVTVTEHISGQGYNTGYQYDSLGNLLQATDSKNQATTYTYDSLNRLTQTTFPDTTTETRTYDSVGSLASRTTQNSSLIQYSYDEINRLTKISYPDGSSVVYVYDKDGNRWKMTDSASTTRYTYDPRGRLLSEARTINSQTYTLTYQYDAASNLLKLTYPDGYQVSYKYDALNRVTSAGTLAPTITYRKNNQLSTITYGNGDQTAYSYDQLGRVSRIHTWNGATSLLDLNYAYDSNGNPTNVNNGQETYGYDDLNRLTSGSGPFGSLSYTYDQVGNRLTQTVNGTQTTYTYGSYNKLLSAGSTSYTYDNNGNTVTKASGSNSWAYTYDYENRLKQVQLNTQTVLQALYDGDGRRIQTVAGDTVVYHYLAGSWDPAYTKDLTTGVTTDVVFSGGLRVGKVQGGSTAYYYHLDRQGSVRLVTQNPNQQTFTAKYLPYGQPYATSGTENFQYTGKQLDVPTGLYYYGYRYLDSQSGRFMTQDVLPPNYMNP